MRFYALTQRPWVVDLDFPEGGYWGLPPGTIGQVELSAVGARDRVFVTSDAPFASGDVLATFGSGMRLDQLVLSGRARNDWNNLLGVSVPNGTTLLDALWNILTIHADPNGATRAKPIMPTHRGVLELYLGGHSLLRSEQLPEDPTLHPGWPVMQRVFRNDYRAIQGRDETLARKWLGAQRLKLRLSDERASELLIDDDLERVPPLDPTTTLLDTFNRGNQAGIGTSSQGTWSWAHVTGTGADWRIFNQRVRQLTNTVYSARAEADLSSEDQSVSIDTVVRDFGDGTWGYLGPIVRFDPSEHTGYAGQVQEADSITRINKIVDGTVSQLTSDTNWSGGLPYRTRLEVDGSTLTLYKDGTLVSSVTDTDITGNLRTGIRGIIAHGDDFEAADLLADAGDDLVRVLGEAVGAVETRARLMAVARKTSEPVGVGHASLRPRSLSRLLGETHGIGEATVSVVEAIGAELLRVVSEAVAATEAVARALVLTRRRHEALGTAETVKSAREMVRLRSEAGTVSETTASVIDAIIAAVVRVVSEVIAMAEMAGRPRHRARSRGETVGLATAIVLVGGVLGAAPAAIADRARMVVRAARRLIVPPARR